MEHMSMSQVYYPEFQDTIPGEQVQRDAAPRIPRKVSGFGAGGLLLMAVSAVAVCAWIAVFLQWVTR